MMGEENRRTPEKWKIEDLVFDRRTLLTLGKLMEEGAFTNIDYLVSLGKEANVYRARAKADYVAIKIYRNETSRFIRKMDYLQGDPRFKKAKMTGYNIIRLFAQKEYKNLIIAEKQGVDAPRPISQKDNVVVMTFIGKDGLPFGKMADVRSEVIEEDFNVIIRSIKALWKGGIVHSDLSEYNILLGDKPYIIDMSEGVSIRHPKAKEFLMRDLVNVSAFFKKSIGLSSNPEELFNSIVSGV
jgi:RIO kinase 1